MRSRFRVDEADLKETLDEFRRILAIEPEPASFPRVCRDPTDDAILAAAVAAKADFLVTGDKDLLVLGPYEGLEILRPGDLLKKVQVTRTP